MRAPGFNQLLPSAFRSVLPANRGIYGCEDALVPARSSLVGHAAKSVDEAVGRSPPAAPCGPKS
jgi:hypothetical protein